MLEIPQNRRERDHDPVYDVKETKEQRGQPSHGVGHSSYNYGFPFTVHVRCKYS
jgi:hypothetical protein